ncbi:MAG: aminopeptidase N [Microbacterium gubbeenense]
MPGENLTRVEAEERRALVDTRGYEIALDLTKGSEVFGSRSVVRFDATPGSTTFIDLIAREVREVTLNGRELSPAEVFADSRIVLDQLEESNELVVDADCEYTNSGEGLHRFVDPVDDEVYLYTQFEVPDSRRVFAVFEQPDLKATFQFTVTAPRGWKVVSNQPAPEPISHEGGESETWGFEPTPRISSYITAIVAGPYEEVRDELVNNEGRTIPLGVFARKSLWEYLDADYIFEKTKQGFAYYEEKFGVPYPFAKFDQLFVPEFNAGAMENAGCVTFTETYIFRGNVSDAVKERRVVTILHELAHMWFGDLVTMKWWNDLWLNESFAEWASTIATAEATEWTGAWTTFNAMEKTWAYKQDQLPSTHPVVATINDLDDVQVNFDGITYAKGGSLLKQLAAYVGIDEFFAGVGAYFRAHAYQNTTLSDLLVELEATSGRDLSAWSAKWLETAGVNTLSPVIDTDVDDKIRRFAVMQTAPSDYPTIRPHRMGIGFYDLEGGSLVRTHAIEVDIDGDLTEIPDLVGVRRPALVLLNDGDLAYAKIRLDAPSLETAITHIAAIEDPLARSLVWGAAWDMTRDGEMATRDYLDLVLAGIGTETESTTIRTTLAQARLAANDYVARDTRSAQRAKLADGLWNLLLGSAPGSDLQLQLASAYAAAASTPAQWERVKTLKNRSVTIPGLDVDTDLEWELLVSLANGGLVASADIDRALEADNTATGGEMAARARAALPGAENKEAAWTSVVDHTDLPNTVLRAATVGFRNAANVDELAPYAERYFASATRVWNERTFQIASYILEGMYPASLASVELRDATRQWLRDNAEEPAALRRIIAENLAGVERALAAQSRDAEEDD